MQENRAQLNRFTTLSSPGSHRLPPGLPAYVNPRIARQPKNMRNVLHLRLDRLHRVLLIILAMPALPGGRRPCVFCGITWHRAQSFPEIYVQLKIICSRPPSLFLSFKAGRFISERQTFTKHGASDVTIDSAVAHAEVALFASRECPRQPQGPSLLSSLLEGSFEILGTLILWFGLVWLDTWRNRGKTFRVHGRANKWTIWEPEEL